MLVLVGFGFFMFRSHVKSKFRHIFKMKELREVEQENWPQITPVVKLDLIKEDIDEGPWAMAMTPLQFCKKNKIFKEDKTKDGRPIAVLEKGPAHRVFALQLGAQWRNLESLPIYTQALFAAFAARGNRDTDGQGGHVGVLVVGGRDCWDRDSDRQSVRLGDDRIVHRHRGKRDPDGQCAR